MADEPNTQQPGQEAPPGNENNGADPQPGQGDGDQEPGPVPYDRFKQVNEKAKDLESRLAKMEEERQTQREAELAEQQKWKELAEERGQKLQEKDGKISSLDLALKRQQVAIEKGLPSQLVDRLRGDTPEELAEDADRLLELVKPAPGPGVPPSSRSARATRSITADMSPDQIRKAARGESE